MNVKKSFNLLMVFMMLVTSLVAFQPVAAQGASKANVERPIVADADYVAGEVVVVFADSQEKNLLGKIDQAVETATENNGEVTRLSMDGTAVIQVEGDAVAVAENLKSQPGVLYAEPNYIFSTPEEQTSSGDEGYKVNSEYVFRPIAASATSNGKSVMAVPKTAIQSMSTLGVYPSDTYFTENQGYIWVGADIVWTNTTPSANVCEIDTGIDSTHPDLTAVAAVAKGKKKKKVRYVTVSRVLPGYDFVDADAVAEDQNGHGTHVAGIIAAASDNSLGIAGVSTGNVVAVRAMDAQGIGTNFDIAAAIVYCANRTDVGVINLSLGSPAPSQAIEDALLYATTPTNGTVPSGAYINYAGKGKLVVAAAGNNNSNQKIYPAAYADDARFTNRVLSVGASGGENNPTQIDYDCRWPQSNYGSWVKVIAPGNDIFSLTPWDKPFYMNYVESGINTRFDYLDGTSMSAAFVSAAAARRMGYKPTETGEQVGADVVSLGRAVDASCSGASAWPGENLGTKQVNVAMLLDRAAIEVSAFDASAGTPLFDATVSAYGGATKYGSSTLPAETLTGSAFDVDSNRVFTYYQPNVDIINLPVKDAANADITYVVTLNKTGYTLGEQPAFQHIAPDPLQAGVTTLYYNASVPPATSSFNVVLGWDVWQQSGYEAIAANNPLDLDLYLWLPTPGTPTYGQPAQFIVGYGGDAFGYVESDPYGTMNAFPYARLKREGGYLDGGPTIESITFANRTAHDGLSTNVTLPYWVGNYNVLATDYGQTIDHDGDGCGDNYGYNYDPNYNNACSGKTPGIPLLGAYYTPYIYVWKDGKIQYFQTGANNYLPWTANDSCNKHWWKAFSILSTTSSGPTYTPYGTPGAPLCDDGATAGFLPYVGTPNNGERIRLLSK